MARLLAELDDGTIIPFDGLYSGPLFSKIKKTSIKEAFEKYMTLVTIKKCLKNQYNEKLYFRKLQTFLKLEKIHFVNDITPEHMIHFENILKLGMKNSSVNRRFSGISNFFSHALDWEMISKNPLDRRKELKVTTPQRKHWTFEHYEKFIPLCEGNRKNIFIFLWITGARPVESRNFKWTDIDYTKNIIYLSCGKPNGNQREFPITEELSQFLHSLKPEGLFLFHENGKAVTDQQLWQYCHHRMRKLGFEKLSPYGSRHSFGTKLDKAGVNVFKIAKLMGHSSLETTRQYCHSENEELISDLGKVK